MLSSNVELQSVVLSITKCRVFNYKVSCFLLAALYLKIYKIYKYINIYKQIDFDFFIFDFEMPAGKALGGSVSHEQRRGGIFPCPDKKIGWRLSVRLTEAGSIISRFSTI